ncbi:ArsC family reductase [Piscinibacter sp.]|uniref:ArsC family reductase n=1 Tax=Piscinibacter sp. TaxID=1903157 RepID=UPI002CEA2A8C|nr:ArsC family reductase [Albitalea sp.]HUG21804.1 ArsC family reductase [Albitalea sp.]
MTGPVLYGIPNCDTVKRALAWLEDRGIEHRFHDFKKGGVPADRMDYWIAALGWEALLNRQGTTWRKLDDAVKAGVTDAASARAAMTAHVSLIRRPVVEWPSGEITVGFTHDSFKQHTREALM